MWHTLTIAIDPLSPGIVQMFPAGTFAASDGRKAGPWRMDRARADELIAAFRKRGQPLAIDYEHQTLFAAKNGAAAPAAGWINDLEWRDEGLFAVVGWTARAKAAIDAGEYRYFSPVFMSRGDRITALGPGAVTNNPALLGMHPLQATSAHIALSMESDPMDELLQKIRQALGLAPDASAEDVSAAFDKHLEEVAKLREAAPNAAHVPLATFEALKSQFVALSARIESADLDAMVAEGLEDGRILSIQEGWARGLDRQALSEYLRVTPPMPRRGQTREIKTSAGTVTLSAEELQVCAQMGLSHDAFIAARDAA